MVFRKICQFVFTHRILSFIDLCLHPRILIIKFSWRRWISVFLYWFNSFIWFTFFILFPNHCYSRLWIRLFIIFIILMTSSFISLPFSYINELAKLFILWKSKFTTLNWAFFSNIFFEWIKIRSWLGSSFFLQKNSCRHCHFLFF